MCSSSRVVFTQVDQDSLVPRVLDPSKQRWRMNERQADVSPRAAYSVKLAKLKGQKQWCQRRQSLYSKHRCPAGGLGFFSMPVYRGTTTHRVQLVQYCHTFDVNILCVDMVASQIVEGESQSCDVCQPGSWVFAQRIKEKSMEHQTESVG